jgi:hypothetical protein
MNSGLKPVLVKVLEWITILLNTYLFVFSGFRTDIDVCQNT